MLLSFFGFCVGFLFLILPIYVQKYALWKCIVICLHSCANWTLESYCKSTLCTNGIKENIEGNCLHKNEGEMYHAVRDECAFDQKTD